MTLTGNQIEKLVLCACGTDADAGARARDVLCAAARSVGEYSKLGDDRDTALRLRDASQQAQSGGWRWPKCGERVRTKSSGEALMIVDDASVLLSDGKNDKVLSLDALEPMPSVGSSAEPVPPTAVGPAWRPGQRVRLKEDWTCSSDAPDGDQVTLPRGNELRLEFELSDGWWRCVQPGCQGHYEVPDRLLEVEA